MKVDILFEDEDIFEDDIDIVELIDLDFRREYITDQIILNLWMNFILPKI